MRHTPRRLLLAVLVVFALAAACGRDPVGATSDASVDANRPDAAPGTPDAVAASVTLLAIGDQGEGNAAQSCVAEAMNAICADDLCDAVLLGGDNFYDNGVSSVDDPQWDTKFEIPYDLPHLNLLPFYAVLGNHDYGLTSLGDKDSQINYSTLPVGNGPGMRASAKWNMPASYFDVGFSNSLVHLFAIDTQDLSDTQKNDMRERVTTSSATWKIVLAHHPRFTSGNHQFDNELLGFLGMFAVQQAIYCDADLLIAGHDHNLEFIDKGQDPSCPNTYFAISGAGAKTRTSGALITIAEQLYFEDTRLGFARMHFTSTELLFEFYDVDLNSCSAPTVSYSKTIPR